MTARVKETNHEIRKDDWNLDWHVITYTVSKATAKSLENYDAGEVYYIDENTVTAEGPSYNDAADWMDTAMKDIGAW